MWRVPSPEVLGCLPRVDAEPRWRLDDVLGAWVRLPGGLERKRWLLQHELRVAS